MMEAVRVCLLCGGISPEREVSLRSGKAVAKALREAGYPVIVCDPAKNSFISSLMRERIDCAFIALHGQGGEDGAMQGFLETMGIPYVGSGVLASAVAMNKIASRNLWRLQHLSQPSYTPVCQSREGHDFSYPCIVKPARGGSTLGVSLCSGPAEVEDALQSAFAYDPEHAIVEEFIQGREVTVAILDDPLPRALPVLEIVPKHGLYDYQTKYTAGLCEYRVPAPVSATAAHEMQQTAIRAYQAIGCRDFARVDMIWNGEQAYVLEVNTIPGMTSLSLLPRAAAAEGIDFPHLVDKLVRRAMSRAQGRPKVEMMKSFRSECFPTR